MKIVAENHADRLRRPGPDTPGTRLLEAVGDDLRALYSDAAGELPGDLLDLARRIDGPRVPRPALAA